MNTLKSTLESILDNTKKKISTIKNNINNMTPTMKSWRPTHRWEGWYIDYYCPDLLDKYINIIPDKIFNDPQGNLNGLKRSDITTIRCYIWRPYGCLWSHKVELRCNNTPEDCGVNVLALDVNFVTMANKERCKQEIVNFFDRVSIDNELCKRLFEYLRDDSHWRYSYRNSKVGRSGSGNVLWNIR